MALSLVPDAALVVDREGNILEVNQALAELFDHEMSALIGQQIELLIPERFRHAHRHDRRDYMEAPDRRSIGAGLELFGRRRDATEFPVDISLAPLEFDGRTLVVATVRDATERGAVTAAVGQLAAIVNTSRDGIVTMTTAGVVTTWNSGAEQLLGTPAEEALGSHIGRWIPQEESEVLEELMGSICAGDSTPPRDTVWLNADLKTVYVAISLSPMFDQHMEMSGFSVLIRDITERKAAETARRNQRRLQEAAAAVRMSSLSDVSLIETLELVCAKTRELTGAIGAAVLRRQQGRLTMAASAGAFEESTAIELAQALMRPRKSGAQWIGVMVTPGGQLVQTLGATFPGRPSCHGALVVLLPPGAATYGGVPAVVEGFAGQGAMAVELSQARAAKNRLLLAEDRERIARDLHDLVIQRLFATGMALQTIQQYLGDQTLVDRLCEATDDLDATIKEIRTTIFALEASPRTQGGMRDELLRLVTGATKTLGFHPSLVFEGPVDLVDGEIRAHAVAVTQEALSNLARHAMASSARVVVRVESSSFSILIEDNGTGIPDRRQESGLAHVRQRADELGGHVDFENRPEGGARLRWEVPV